MIREVPATQAKAALLKKGFCEAKKRDHQMFFLRVNQQTTPFLIKISHGATVLRKDEIKNTALKHAVPADDIYRIVSCDYDAQQTIEVYRRSRWPRQNEAN